MIAEKFQIHGVKITGKNICKQKNQSAHFYSCPQAKPSSKILLSPIQAERNYPFPPNKVFGKSIFR